MLFTVGLVGCNRDFRKLLFHALTPTFLLTISMSVSEQQYEMGSSLVIDMFGYHSIPKPPRLPIITQNLYPMSSAILKLSLIK